MWHRSLTRRAPWVFFFFFFKQIFQLFREYVHSLHCQKGNVFIVNIKLDQVGELSLKEMGTKLNEVLRDEKGLITLVYANKYCFTSVSLLSFFVTGYKHISYHSHSWCKKTYIYLSNEKWKIKNSYQQTGKLNNSRYLKCFSDIWALVILLTPEALLIFCSLCVLLTPVTVIIHTHTHTHTQRQRQTHTDTLTVWSVTIISGLIFSSIRPATLDTGMIHTHGAYIVEFAHTLCSHAWRPTHTRTHTHTHTHTHTKALLPFSCCETDVSGVSLWGEQTECRVMKSSVKTLSAGVCVFMCVLELDTLLCASRPY